MASILANWSGGTVAKYASRLACFRSSAMYYETIRRWCRTFGRAYARRLRHRRGSLGDTWYLDELFVTLNGRQQYLWRAVDEDGDLLDILVQSRRNRRAAVRFFRRLLKRQGCVPCCGGSGRCRCRQTDARHVRPAWRRTDTRRERCPRNALNAGTSVGRTAARSQLTASEAGRCCDEQEFRALRCLWVYKGPSWAGKSEALQEFGWA